MYETVIETLDSSRSMLVRDIGDMMYARAESEERQLLLDEATAKNRETEKRLFVASVIVATLLIGGLFIVQLIRRKQKNKLLQFKLNMARNIHDEANPALLYAKALVKARRLDNDLEKSGSELERHIDHTMQLIRSLSHDLKSEKQYIQNDLVTKTHNTLNKLNVCGDFTFDIHENIDKKRFVSHYQFSQIMAVLNECITNTIKHASFDKINIAFSNSGNHLTITYGDNGKGWEKQYPDKGIGIINMGERIEQINGTMKIENNYPNGYEIVISCFLR
jgi:signal transduction histidine kinase